MKPFNYDCQKCLMNKITETQQETFDFIVERLAETDLPPTRQEIADHFGIHPNAAHERLKALDRKRLIKLIPAISRGIRVL